jgi:phage shock protein A/phage-related protein
MARTIGRIDFVVGADGKTLPAQLKAIGKTGGLAAGKEFNTGFQKSLSTMGKYVSNEMRRNGKFAGISFSKDFQSAIKSKLSGLSSELARLLVNKNGSAFNDLVAQMGSVSAASDKLQGDLAALRDENVLTNDQWKEGSDQIQQWASKAQIAENNANAFREQQEKLRQSTEEFHKAISNRDAYDSYVRYTGSAGSASERLNTTLKKMKESGAVGDFEFHRLTERVTEFSGAIDKNNGKIDKSNGGLREWYRGLSTNARQWTLIISAIAAAGQEIAVLGSVAGSSLAVLAIAATGLGTAVGVTIAAFRGMNGDLDKVAPSARGAAVALKELGAGFSLIQDSIQGALFDELAGPIQNLTNTLLPVLNTGLTGIADSVGRVFGDLSAALTSDLGLSNFEALLSGFQPIVESLGHAFINFGGAIGNIFVIGLPFAQAFSDSIADIAASFNLWSSSEEGRAMILKFFEHGQEIIGAILPFLVSVGQALASLVTDESVDKTAGFFATLTEFVPILGEILSTLGDLNIFGLLADALLSVGQVIEPLLPSLGLLFKAVSGALMKAFETLVPVLITLAEAFIPVVDVVTELIGSVLPPLIDLLAPVLQGIAGLAAGVLEGFVPAIATLVGGVADLAPAFLDIATALTPLIAESLPLLVDLFLSMQPVTQMFVETLIGLLPSILALIPPFLQIATAILPPLLEIMISLVQGGLFPLIETIRILAPPIIDIITLFAQGLLPIIDAAVVMFGGLADFLAGVFLGDWDRAWSGVGRIFQGVWDGIVATLKLAVNFLIDTLNGLFKALDNLGQTVRAISGGALGFDVDLRIPRLASGYLTSGPMFAQIGEAGREAVVPLDRPLSQVNPAVRPLAEFAQGKSSGNGDGKTTTIEAGAITIVTPASDPAIVASMVIDELADGGV